MRPPERIPIFLNLVDWNKLLFNFKIFKYQDDIDKTCFKIYKNLDLIKQYWADNPDLRISQVLVNTNIIRNVPGNWYYREDKTWLDEQGIAPSEHYYWISRVDKEGNMLKKPKFSLVKDLEKNHLENIINDYNQGKYLIDGKTLNLIADLLKTY